MLDYSKLMQQIELVGSDSLLDSQIQKDVYGNAQEAFDTAIAKGGDLLDRLEASRAWVLWPVATPLEPLGTIKPIPDKEPSLTAVGVDGSQIMPSHHEVLACYLLNIGVALITYGAKQPPLFASFPRLYHRAEDLYPLVDRRRIHIDELYVSLERTLLELEMLAQQAVGAQERGLPVTALYDGSLIPWSLEKLPPSYQDTYLKRMAAALDSLRLSRIPILGYLSHSRSADLVNLLRVSVCPYEVSHCAEYCGHLNEEDFPCSDIWPLADRQLFKARLSLHSRSAMFLSAASISKLLAKHDRICFTYLNVGGEIARLELPRWVFDDAELLEQGLAAVLSQCKKGMGYPLVLSEAHHLAVVKGGDRVRFFELISRHLVELGMKQVETSPKESKKRIGFV